MRRFFRPRPLAITVLTCLVLYTLIGFFLVPYLIKAYAIPAVAEKLSRPVLVNEVEMNPFALSLHVTGFEIRERDQTALLGFDEVFVDFEAVSLFRLAYVFDTIRFNMPYVSTKVLKDGRMNLAGLASREESPATKQPESPSAIPAVEIGHFEIVSGIVEFRDESKPRPFSLDIVPIDIILNDFHTKPGGDNTYTLTGELSKGATLDWKGTISLEPIRSEGTLSVTGVKIPRNFQYIQDQFNFTIPSGTMQVQGRYRFDASGSSIDLEVSDASLQLADVHVAEKDDPDPVIMIPSFEVGGIHLDLRKRNVSIATVALADATDRVWRNPDGSINLQHLFVPVASESSGAQPAEASAGEEPSWAVQIADVQVKNHTIHFEDRSLATTMRADVTGLSAKTHDFAFPITKPIPLKAEHRINETGTVAVDGQIIVKPFQLDMALALKNIAIQPFQPYFEKFALVVVDTGSVDLDGQVHLAMEHGRDPLMTFHGNAGVVSLAIADRDQGLPLASWKQFRVNKIGLAVDPTTVSIEEVGLEQPVVHVAVLPDGQLNFKKLLPEPDAAAASPASGSASVEAKTGPSPSIAIKTVKLLKGTVTFKDESITPTVQTGLYDLTGTIKGLSSKQLAKADVDLSGKVDKVAPLKIAGKINPLTEDAFTDLAVKFDNVDLTVATPYSGKYAGYPIHKGKLFLDLTYKVSKKQLEAENKVRVDQLTFGEKTNSPDATSLPVPLAVALLKDRNGRIDIDLPIRGDLNDPDFKYGKVVFSTLVNILTKMVASPFALMGKLIPGGGDGESLQYVEFAPGGSSLIASELTKVETLTKGLEQRPGLRLEVTGTANPTRDRKALALQKLNEQLLLMWQQEKGGSKETSMPVEEQERLIRKLFEKGRSQQPVAPSARKPDVAQKPPTSEEMRQALVASIAVDDAALRTLAHQRADNIRERFVGGGRLASERVFLTEVDLTSSGDEEVRSRLNITAGQ
jgi:uncharacterized protein involved in outer membrane biogenesis